MIYALSSNIHIGCYIWYQSIWFQNDFWALGSELIAIV